VQTYITFGVIKQLLEGFFNGRVFVFFIVHIALQCYMITLCEIQSRVFSTGFLYFSYDHPVCDTKPDFEKPFTRELISQECVALRIRLNVKTQRCEVTCEKELSTNLYQLTGPKTQYNLHHKKFPPEDVKFFRHRAVLKLKNST